MTLIRNLAFAWLAASVALGACAIDSRTPEDSPPESDNARTTYITSAEDLQVYLQTTTDSPLDRLSPAARQRFINSLVFTRYGLASYEYADLKAISTADAARILDLFRPTSGTRASQRTSGASDRAVARAVSPHDDFVDYVCKPSDGGCVGLQNHICNTTTCRVQ